MLGRNSSFAKEYIEHNRIGMNFDVVEDISFLKLSDYKNFSHKLAPIISEACPNKTRISIGRATGALWRFLTEMKQEDIVVTPDGNNNYIIGTISSDYIYTPNKDLPHQREVKWLKIISKEELSQPLLRSLSSPGTITDLAPYSSEIDSLLTSNQEISSTSSIPFLLEKYLEEFMVSNWNNLELAKEYDILSDEEGITGRQYIVDTGKIDILAISKDKKILLVIELKKGKPSDDVVGQIQRYMGYVKHELAEPYQTVKGIIIGFEDDLRIKRALQVASDIEYYKYEMSFGLTKS